MGFFKPKIKVLIIGYFLQQWFSNCIPGRHFRDSLESWQILDSKFMNYLTYKTNNFILKCVINQILKYWRPSVLGSSPSGSRNTQGMSGVGEEEDRHTQKVAQRRQLSFIFRTAQFLQNECYLPLKSPHITSDIGFVLLSIFFFTLFFPYAFIQNISNYRAFS